MVILILCIVVNTDKYGTYSNYRKMFDLLVFVGAVCGNGDYRELSTMWITLVMVDELLMY